MHHIIPDPRSGQEAYLLLEAARADRSILLARKSLALQIIRRNTLVLQYNRMALERAQDDVRAADRFVGQVRFSIRKSGQSAASEYALREAHSPPTSGIFSKSSGYTMQLTICRRATGVKPSFV